MPITAPLVILGQITGAAFAAGLNLYLTVALIGISARFGWIPALPPGLKGLENTVLLTSAIVLYLVEFVVDKLPHAVTIWDALHTIIRPVATALLTVLALGAAPLHWQIGGGILAGVVALASHSAKAGLRLVLNRSPSKLRNMLISMLEDLFAAAMAVVALRYPVMAISVGGAAMLIVVLLGPSFWRALALAGRAITARVRAFFGSAGWHPTTDLPPKLQQLIEPLPLGRGEPRAARAALKGLKGVGAYRSGWVVFSYDRASFLYRSLFGSRSMPMPRLEQPEVKHGVWTDIIEFRHNGGTCTLFLLKDGPKPEVAVADLARVP